MHCFLSIAKAQPKEVAHCLVRDCNVAMPGEHSASLHSEYSGGRTVLSGTAMLLCQASTVLHFIVNIRRAYCSVRDCNAGGCAGLCEAIALHHRAAEGHFQELLHVVGQGGATCHDEAHLPPQAGLHLVEHQPVKEWRRL